MKLNSYLKELGYKWEDLPGNYDEKMTSAPAGDPRNEEDEEGFCGYEFFSLDHSLALYIYPRLCYFRDHIMNIGTPSCFCSMGNNKKASKEGQRLWHETVNKMCEAFRLILEKDTKAGYEAINQRKIDEGLHLFATYYHCLWY